MALAAVGAIPFLLSGTVLWGVWQLGADVFLVWLGADGDALSWLARVIGAV
jgi:hypothetical protein